MRSSMSTIGGALALGALVAMAGVAAAQDDDAMTAAIEARQAHMGLIAFNLGPLVTMARGERDYDQAAAAAAADNLLALSRLDQTGFWPPGSDLETLGVDRTEALARLWDDPEGLEEQRQRLIAASTTMAEAAPNGLDALRAAVGPLGQACSACHEVSRVSR